MTPPAGSCAGTAISKPSPAIPVRKSRRCIRWIFLLPADQPELKKRIQEVFDCGESSVQAPFLCRGGRTIPHFFTGRRVEFDGRLCLLGVGIDISARREAEAEVERSERRWRTTLESILEGCQIVAHDWTYLYLNPAAARQNKRPASDFLGKKLTEVWPGVERTRVFEIVHRSMTARIPLQEEVNFVFPDGSEGWFDLRVQPVPEGVFMLSIDITERHRAEQALRALNESLEHTVAERTAELQTARLRAESADRLKSAFLATMSHELRTPLNSIIGFTGIVLQELAGPLNAEQAKQLGMVRSSARHLLDLINDVLDISKIEAGQLDIRQEHFDLRAAMVRMVDVVRPLAEQKQLALEAVLDPKVGVFHGDRRRIEQILLNLLNNAVKFTEKGGVVLRADFASFEGGERLRVRVSDTGIGIAPEDVASLFQPFRQIDTGLTRQHEGTGLGLAICRRLSALMGGTITVESRPGEGSTFTLLLPRLPEAAP